MIKPIPGLEEYYGRTLKPELQTTHPTGENGTKIIINPDYYESREVHIQMHLLFDKEYKFIGAEGYKTYTWYGSMWSRSGSHHERDWSKKDIAYLKKYIKNNTI